MARGSFIINTHRTRDLNVTSSFLIDGFKDERPRGLKIIFFCLV